MRKFARSFFCLSDDPTAGDYSKTKQFPKKAYEGLINLFLIVIKNCLPLTLWRFHFVFVIWCLRWSYLDAPFDIRNAQFIHLRFPVYRFHPQKQRHNQHHWNIGQNRRTFVKNVATFGGRFLVCVHDGFQLTNSCSMKLDCRANCLISLQQFHVPVIRDMSRRL